jgi:hypothetical protein
VGMFMASVSISKILPGIVDVCVLSVEVNMAFLLFIGVLVVLIDADDVSVDVTALVGAILVSVVSEVDISYIIILFNTVNITERFKYVSINLKFIVIFFFT